MRTVRSISSLRQILHRERRKGNSIGFIPTMGYFHDGHLSLMRRSKKENDITLVSIFVNPLQFSPGEDFQRYPRNEKHDELLAKKENVDIIFCPSIKEMYPDRYLTHVDVNELSSRLCGKSRSGHFRGVTTVLCKLLNIVQCNRLYLGQKDAQQAVIIRKMIEDLNIHVQVKTLPIVREHDGLAMSSRNVYLSFKERQDALMLFASLREARRLIQSGVKNASVIKKVIRNRLKTKRAVKIDYVECVSDETLKPLKKLKGRVLIACAIFAGKTRLIDNIILNIR